MARVYDENTKRPPAKNTEHGAYEVLALAAVAEAASLTDRPTVDEKLEQVKNRIADLEEDERKIDALEESIQDPELGEYLRQVEAREVAKIQELRSEEVDLEEQEAANGGDSPADDDGKPIGDAVVDVAVIGAAAVGDVVSAPAILPETQMPQPRAGARRVPPKTLVPDLVSGPSVNNSRKKVLDPKAAADILIS